jgi:hypothetical protein
MSECHLKQEEEKENLEEEKVEKEEERVKFANSSNASGETNI